MERITRSGKIMETIPKTASGKRGKKKSEILNGMEEDRSQVEAQQNIRRSLRGKVSADNCRQSRCDSLSALSESLLLNLDNSQSELTCYEPEQNSNIQSESSSNELHDPPLPSNESINVLEDCMSRCDIIDDKKYPVVLVHQLNEISSRKEYFAEFKNVEIDRNDRSINVLTESIIKEGIADSSNNLVGVEEIADEEVIKIKKEPIIEQQIQVENEEFSNLRRSRRLMSIFHDTVNESLEVQKLEESTHQQQLQQEIKHESIVKSEQLEETVKVEEIFESIDVANDTRLSQFLTIKENIYLKSSDKIICKINKTMKCDCTITEADIKSGELGCTFNCINRLLYIECSPKCRCGQFCDNQQFQRHNYSPVSVCKTEKKGFGIRADADIPPETFIIEYVGEVLNNKQFEKRAAKYSKDKNRHYYFMALRSNAVIDATVKGNISRFINHSCDPNAITQKWTINGELRVGFFSVRFIRKGEEITFDYQFQRYGKEAQRCFCESGNCRGWIGENPESDEELLELSRDKKGVKPKKAPPAKIKSKVKIVENDEGSNCEIKNIEAELKKVEPSVKTERKGKKLYEDLEIEEQIKDLTKSGLKNRVHTIALARLVVRAKSVESRSSLLKLLIAGELPCRRLFLDYNGLKLLHNWMCDISVKSSIPDLYLCVEILNALSLLPITNKTILRDCKVLERVEKWKNLDIEKKKLTKEEKKRAKESKKKIKIGFQDQPLSDSNGPLKEESNATFTMTFDVLEELPTMKLILKGKAAALLQKWEILKEDFRIPKKQKQENRKEHEKQAGLEDDLWNEEVQQKSTIVVNDRAKNRFGNEIYNNRSTSHQHISSAMHLQSATPSYRRYIDPMEKQERRKLFEKQELERQMLLEHENNCAIFGLPPDTVPTSIPVKVNRVTGECFQIFDNKVSRPPNFHEFKYEPLTLSTNPDDYHLPLIDLPEHWRFAINESGCIYYYHEKIRISQWEAPIKLLPLFSTEEDLEQRIICDNYENLGTPDDNESSTDTEDSEEDELREILDMLKRKKRKLNGHIGFEQISTDISTVEKYVEEDLEKRIKLNSSITGSLDNPVKILPIEGLNLANRKKRRGLVTMMKFIRPRTEEDKLYGRIESRRYKEIKEKLRRRKKKRLQQGEGDMSDEDDDDDELVDEAGFSGRMVDELDILTKSKYLDKSSKIKTDVDVADVSKLKKQLPRPMPQNDQSLIKRQFRDDIKEEIAKYLLPYRAESCTNGRIESEEDYLSLINKLTFSVLTKESKHCALNSSMLKATDSVKGKTKEFIKKYMSKFQGPYQRKADEQDYSLILNKY